MVDDCYLFFLSVDVGAFQARSIKADKNADRYTVTYSIYMHT